MSGPSRPVLSVVVPYPTALPPTQVENFQPFYIFNKRYATDLRIGAAIIREALERETTKEEVVARKRAEEKAAHEAAVAKVRRFFSTRWRTRKVTRHGAAVLHGR